MSCEPRKTLEPLEEEKNRQISWLRNCQILCPGSTADGAIKRYPNVAWITPYFANFAAAALLEDPKSIPLVRRYLDWYIRHLEPDGTVYDYQYEGNDWGNGRNCVKKVPPDSEDAYAGTFLSLVCLYCQKSGDYKWAAENLPFLFKISQVITSLTDGDGLTFALAKYRVKYLMDNCEAWRGLYDFSQLLFSLGDQRAEHFKKQAGLLAAGVEKYLWNARRRCYHPAKIGFFKSPVNLKIFYPDAVAQLFPALYGLIDPGSQRALSLYQVFNAHQPGWVTITPPDYPWVLLAYCACLHGDQKSALQKLNYVQKSYIENNSSYWFCSEAAFFVLTAAKLLKEI